MLLLFMGAAPMMAPALVRASAMPRIAPRFDASLAGSVFAAAFGFVAPRSLVPVTVPTLTLWGLQGLTALDPDLMAERAGATIQLSRRGKPLVTVPVPAGDGPDEWANVAERLGTAAWDASASVRRAGTEGVIKAFFADMLDPLDPYSRYVGPVDAATDEADRAGEAGIGVVLAPRGRTITVKHTIADGPAALGGVEPDDRILSVDGDSTRGVALAEVQAWLDGPENTSVVIDVAGRHGRRRLTLTRADVPEENVFTRRDGAALVVRISSFTDRTASRLDSALEEAVPGKSRPRGIVLDLRGNRGGLVRQAVSAADALLEAGVVAVTKGRDPAADRIWRSVDGELDPGLPVVVLVDGRTASAAEIVAAALADRGRAVVVGSSTLGKGLVQTITRLPNGGELVLTWSRVLAPRGWPIQGLGVVPQVCTSLGEAEMSRQLAALAGKVAPMGLAVSRERDARAPVPQAEILAIRETCPAAEGSDLDPRAAQTLIGDPSAYATALLPPPAPDPEIGAYNPAAATILRKSAAGLAP